MSNKLKSEPTNTYFFFKKRINTYMNKKNMNIKIYYIR